MPGVLHLLECNVQAVRQGGAERVFVHTFAVLRPTVFMINGDFGLVALFELMYFGLGLVGLGK